LGQEDSEVHRLRVHIRLRPRRERDTLAEHLPLRFERRLKKLGESAAMSPVLRKLSASCGTCVRFTATFQSELADEDLEAV